MTNDCDVGIVYESRFHLYGYGHKSRAKIINDLLTPDLRTSTFALSGKLPDLGNIKCIYLDTYSSLIIDECLDLRSQVIIFADCLREAGIPTSKVHSSWLVLDPFGWSDCDSLTSAVIKRGLEYAPVPKQQLFQQPDNAKHFAFVILRKSVSHQSISQFMLHMSRRQVRRIIVKVDDSPYGKSFISDVVSNCYSNDTPEIIFLDGHLDYSYYFSRCQYVFSPASMSALEALTLGCEVFLYQIAENQIPILRSLVKSFNQCIDCSGMSIVNLNEPVPVSRLGINLSIVIRSFFRDYLI